MCIRDREGSDIYIKARKEDRYVIISIEDNGAGIPDDMNAIKKLNKNEKHGSDPETFNF